mgnify:CR=1 FL=1
MYLLITQGCVSLEKKVLFLNQKIASRKAVNRDSINTKVFEEEGGRFGGGKGDLSGERSPPPNALLSPKTFNFIESLFMLLGEWREVVFVNEESAVLKIFGAF